MRGASALAKLLTDLSGQPLRLLVIWEPVIASDRGPPKRAVRALFCERGCDQRVAQFWDRNRSLSKKLVAAKLPWLTAVEQIDEELVIWDFVALFPPGVTWSVQLPAPLFSGQPVVKQIRSLRGWLKTGSLLENSQ